MLVSVLKSAWFGFNEHRLTRLASSIAFVTVFSLVPLFVVLIAAGSWIFGFETGTHNHSVVEASMLKLIRERAGDATAETMRSLIDQTYSKPHQTKVARLIGAGTLFLGASGLFGALQDSLNTVWEIDKKRGGWRQMVRDRIASYVMFLLLGVLVIALFLASIAGTAADLHFTASLPAWATELVTFGGAVMTIIILSVVFMALFKVLPDVNLSWSQAFTGGGITGIFFFIGQVLIAIYFARGGVLTAYGAAGSILVALLWIYYSALIFLFGAEITRALNIRASEMVQGGNRDEA